MVLVDHTQTSEGFTGGFPVGVRESKSSGGDEPGIHIRVVDALSHENHYVALKSAPGVVLPVDVLWWVHHSNTFQAEYQKLRKAELCMTDSANLSIVNHLEQDKN